MTQEPATTEKTGVKTSEFWMAIVMFVTTAIPAAAVSDKWPWLAAVLAVIATTGPLIYIIGRAMLKAEKAKQIAIIPDAWEPTLENMCTIIEQLTQLAQTIKSKTETSQQKE